jgi:hypothetical protein
MYTSRLPPSCKAWRAMQIEGGGALSATLVIGAFHQVV